MKSKQIIPLPPAIFPRKEIPKEKYLNISELFTDTIQGEGIHTGCPATFLRLQGCTLNCSYCDTHWNRGNPYSFEEIFGLMEKFGIIEKLRKGHHLVITGGSPLKQQEALLNFLVAFTVKYNLLPFVEIENECTIKPHRGLIDFVGTWNNSPKLCNSGNPWSKRYRPEVLKFLSDLEDSWFKFVITNDKDWSEIKSDYLDEGLIKREQVILMPQGATRKELMINQTEVVEIAIRENVRYCSREHIILWDNAVGV